MDTQGSSTMPQFVLTTYIVLIAKWLVLNFTLKIPALKTVIEILICNLTIVIFSPVLLSIIGFNILVRHFISNFVLGDRFKLINGIDAVWAPEYPFIVPHFTSLYVFQGKCDLEKIRKKINLITKDPNYVRLNYRVTQKCGYYCWEDMTKSFDVKNHVKYLTGCENPDKELSEDQVFQKIENIYDDMLPGTKPQWEILVIPNFKYNTQESGETEKPKRNYGLLFRMHHSILDGVSAGQLLQHGMADYPVKVTVDPLKSMKMSVFMKILPYVLMAIVGPRSVMKSLMLRDSNCFHGKPMTGPKHIGWSRQIDLEALKQIKNATKSSTTAVLVSSFGGSLRKLAMKKNLPVPQSIYAAATVAILPYPDLTLQNRFTSAHVPMEIGLNTPAERLASAFKHANNMARSPDILLNYHSMQLTGTFPALIINEMMKNLNSTMLLSNVPGPAENIYMFDGDRLLDAVAWAPFKGVTAIGMTLFSYAGKIRAAVVADNVAFPAPSDMPTLLSEFEDEIVQLAKSSGVKTECFST